MRSRFRKVWCASCSTMQFAGECPHGRSVDGREPYPAGMFLEIWNVPPLNPMMTGSDVSMIEVRRLMKERRLILPDPAIWTLYEAHSRCSCTSCSVSAPCENLAGA